MNLRFFPFVAVSLICTTHLLAQTPEEPPEVHQESGTTVVNGEWFIGADPLKTDSDGDGLPDGVEVGSPLDPNHDDTPIIEFFAERTRQLNLPAPLIERGEDGQLNLRLRLETSQDLREWFKLILGEQSISVDDGEILVALPGEVEGTQFFLLRPQD